MPSIGITASPPCPAACRANLSNCRSNSWMNGSIVVSSIALRIAHAQLKGWLVKITADPGQLSADVTPFDQPGITRKNRRLPMRGRTGGTGPRGPHSGKRHGRGSSP
ncbi:hypothetical protein ABGB18_18440 [Nonomuraea sp. B12E4]|uniref:hypothetical protein n=1 Tax=Nonomuraea sp. B12E4 TaxID=3153564 RepID=UPI00325EB8C9